MTHAQPLETGTPTDDAIYIYDGITSTVARTVSEQLENLSHERRRDQVRPYGQTVNPRPIVVRLNSDGGELFAGLAIYHALRACPVPVIAVVDGLAASAASIILMAADRRLMRPHAMLLVHELSFGHWGTFSQGQDAVTGMTMAMNSIASIYFERASPYRTMDQVREWLRRDTWFDATTAVEWGLATRVLRHDQAILDGVTG